MRKAMAWSSFVALALLSISTVLSAATPPEKIIPMEKAQSAALDKYPGTVKGSELEQEEGKWVYSFDILGRDKSIHEVWVDAKNGRIVKHKVESASEEAKEATEEKNR